jgi:hypothetical protein
MSPEWVLPKKNAKAYDAVECTNLQKFFLLGYDLGRTAMKKFQQVCSVPFPFVCELIAWPRDHHQNGKLHSVNPLSDNQEPCSPEEKAKLDGFLEAHGFVMVEYNLLQKLIDMSEMRDGEGNRRFAFLPNKKELQSLSQEELRQIPLTAAQVMHSLPGKAPYPSQDT